MALHTFCKLQTTVALSDTARYCKIPYILYTALDKTQHKKKWREHYSLVLRDGYGVVRVLVVP